MTEQRVKVFILPEPQYLALRDFIGSLNMPWKQTNPYMQILEGLREVKVHQPTPPAEPPAEAPPPMQAPKAEEKAEEKAETE